MIRADRKVENGESLIADACPAKTQCTAVDNDGQMETFQPLTGKHIASATIDKPVGLDAPSGDSDNELDAVACTSAKICIAVDTLGNAVTFNPRSRHSATPTAIDPGHALLAIACPSSKECVAVDSAGRALQGAPDNHTWTVEPLPDATPLLGVACVSTSECVAVDDAGQEFRAQ